MRFARDKDRFSSEIKVNDLVYHTRPYYGKNQQSGLVQKGLSKLLGKWKGPDKVVRRINPNTFVVLVDGSEMTFNVTDLALYKGEEPPLYRERPFSLP